MDRLVCAFKTGGSGWLQWKYRSRLHWMELFVPSWCWGHSHYIVYSACIYDVLQQLSIRWFDEIILGSAFLDAQLKSVGRMVNVITTAQSGVAEMYCQSECSDDNWMPMYYICVIGPLLYVCWIGVHSW